MALLLCWPYTRICLLYLHVLMTVISTLENIKPAAHSSLYYYSTEGKSTATNIYLRNNVCALIKFQENALGRVWQKQIIQVGRERGRTRQFFSFFFRWTLTVVRSAAGAGAAVAAWGVAIIMQTCPCYNEWLMAFVQVYCRHCQHVVFTKWLLEWVMFDPMNSKLKNWVCDGRFFFYKKIVYMQLMLIIKVYRSFLYFEYIYVKAYESSLISQRNQQIKLKGFIFHIWHWSP